MAVINIRGKILIPNFCLFFSFDGPSILIVHAQDAKLSRIEVDGKSPLGTVKETGGNIHCIISGAPHWYQNKTMPPVQTA